MSSGQNYSEEERLAAWAAYYAQQGYDQATIQSMMSAQGLSASASSSADVDTGPSTSYKPGDPVPGYDANGYKIGTVGSGGSGAAVTTAPVLGSESSKNKKKKEEASTGKGKAPSSGKAQSSVKAKAAAQAAGKRETVIRKAGGKMWEDPTLLEWDPKWYRLFVGDVSNDVTERTLDEAFNKYRTYCKSKIVRDRLSQKAKYGFIAFKDPEDFLRAWKEMDGKYVGNRPIRLSKIKEDKYGTIDTVAVSARKAKTLEKLRRNHGKPDNRPTLW